MTSTWRQRRAERRVQSGNGQTLPRYRWWQLFNRSLFVIDIADANYLVDIRQWGDSSDGEVRARLYRDGVQVAVSKVPARFSVEDGDSIEVAMGGYGIKRCHYLPTSGDERQLTPHPASAEGRRAHLHRARPRLSAVITAVATIVVLVGVVIALVQLIDPISQIPPIRETFGDFESPLRLPLWLNLTIGVAVAIATTERALRMRTSWLDSLAN